MKPEGLGLISRKMGNMKVVMYTPTAEGGHARFTECLMDGICEADKGIDLCLLTSENLSEEYRNKRYKIHAILPPIRRRSTYRSSASWLFSRINHYVRRDLQLIRWLERERPNIVHLQEWCPETGSFLIRRLQRAGIRVVVSVHNLVRHEQHFPGHKRIQAWADRRVWRSADCVIVLADRIGAGVNAAGVPARKIRCVPHWVWPGGVVLGPHEHEAKRQLKTALLFGSVRRNKGVEVFIDACGRTPDIRGLIAGYTDDKSYAESIARRIASSSGNIVFENRFLLESEVGALFRRASVAVLPYTAFGSQSGAVFMAVAHETPVIGSDVGALGDTIRQEHNGIVLSSITAQALAAALTEIHGSQVYHNALENCSRMKACYTPEAIGRLTSSIYHEIG